MAQVGIGSEAGPVLERMERILLAAKGPDSLAMNQADHARLTLLSDGAAMLDVRKRMLARAEKVTGPKSQESLFALREVAWTYPRIDDWPEEQSTLATLKERTLNWTGPSGREYVDLLEHIANRSADHRQFDDALATLDQALAIVRSTPGLSEKQYLAQRRAEIERQKLAPPLNRWFDRR